MILALGITSRMQFRLLLQVLVIFYKLQENFEALELSVKFLKEGQNREFDLSLRRIPIKSNTTYDI